MTTKKIGATPNAGTAAEKGPGLKKQTLKDLTPNGEGPRGGRRGNVDGLSTLICVQQTKTD